MKFYLVFLFLFSHLLSHSILPSIHPYTTTNIPTLFYFSCLYFLSFFLPSFCTDILIPFHLFLWYHFHSKIIFLRLFSLPFYVFISLLSPQSVQQHPSSRWTQNNNKKETNSNDRNLYPFLLFFSLPFLPTKSWNTNVDGWMDWPNRWVHHRWSRLFMERWWSSSSDQNSPPSQVHVTEHQNQLLHQVTIFIPPHLLLNLVGWISLLSVLNLTIPLV